MSDLYNGLVAISVAVLAFAVLWLSFRAWERRHPVAPARKDSAPRRSSPEGDASEDAESRPTTLAARLDEVEYRFDALKRAHEQLSESIGTRFATMGKRITRAGVPAQPSDAEEDSQQPDFLTALGAVPPRPSNGASHNGARRLIARGAPRR